MSEASKSEISGFDEKLGKLKSATVNPLVLEHLNRRIELGVEEGNCTHFIRRKQRYCSRRAVAGSVNGTCSEHSEEALAESRKQNDISRQRYEQRKALSAENSSQVLEEPSAKRKRVSAPKRMANPFSSDLTPQIDPNMNWSAVYNVPDRPLHIDVGCAKGRCVERLSQKSLRSNWNQLGLEIRDSLVQYSLEKLTPEDKERKNLHFMTNNFAVTADALLTTLPRYCTRLISFQFPDPWRRAKHEKRLIVQPQLIQVLAKHMSEGAAVYLSSDCEQVAERMKLCFSKSNYFSVILKDSQLFITSESQSEQSITANAFFRKTPVSMDGEAASCMDENGWIKINPLDEPSERELVCELEWKRVWRCVFVRNSTAFDETSNSSTQVYNDNDDDGDSGDDEEGYNSGNEAP